MNLSQQNGYLFEKKVHDTLAQTNYLILKENDIIRKYGKLCFGIDHLIYCREIIIGIQDKWTESKPSLSQINHFVSSLKKIGNFEKKKLFGIYLSKLPITSGAISSFDYENSNSSNYFTNINDCEQEKLLKKLIKLFYLNDIYLYEYDGSIIMLDY